MPLKPTPAILAIALLSACDVTPAADPGTGETPARRVAAPQGAAPDTCWGREDAETSVREVIRDVEVVPPRTAADGTILTPGVYRRETVRELSTDGAGTLFEIPCPGTTVPDFAASLQRALAARGLFAAPVTGRYDRATRAAIRRYQQGFGLDSAQVSRRMAEELGLAIARP